MALDASFLRQRASQYRRLAEETANQDIADSYRLLAEIDEEEANRVDLDDPLPGDPVREIERLKVLAAWYRSWAELAGNDREREGRLRLAELIEAQIAVVVTTVKLSDESNLPGEEGTATETKP